MELSRQDTGVGSCSLLQGIFPTQGSPTLQADSLTADPPGKPKNTGVDSLSLFQHIFLAEELNQGLLHCKQILYQLSQQEIPKQYYNSNKLSYTWENTFNIVILVIHIRILTDTPVSQIIDNCGYIKLWRKYWSELNISLYKELKQQMNTNRS